MLINDFLTSALLIIGLRNFVKILRLRMFQQDGLGDTIGLLTGLAAEKPLGARGPGLPCAGRAREGSPWPPGRTSGASVAVWGQSGDTDSRQQPSDHVFPVTRTNRDLLLLANREPPKFYE